MQIITMQQRFDASPERVFAAITDHVGFGKCLHIAMRVEREGVPAPNGLGAVRVVPSRGFSVREEVVRWEPPHAMDYRVVSGAPLQNHLGEIRVTPDGSGSRIDYQIRFALPWYLGGAMVGGVLAGMLRKEISAGLQRMAAELMRA